MVILEHSFNFDWKEKTEIKKPRPGMTSHLRSRIVTRDCDTVSLGGQQRGSPLKTYGDLAHVVKSEI